MNIIDRLVNFFKKYLWRQSNVSQKALLPPAVKGLHGWMIALPVNHPRCLVRWKIVIGIYVSQSSSEEYHVQLSHLNIEKDLPKPEKSKSADTHVIQIVKKKISGINKRVLKRYLVVLAYVDGSKGRPHPDLVMKNITTRLCYDMINTADGITVGGMEKSLRESLKNWLGSDGSLTLIDVEKSNTNISTEV